jgi:hypothetical protein
LYKLVDSRFHVLHGTEVTTIEEVVSVAFSI